MPRSNERRAEARPVRAPVEQPAPTARSARTAGMRRIAWRIRRAALRLSGALSDTRGSATLEFLGIGVLLLVPIAYGMLTLAQLEQAMLATETAARNGARTLVSQAVPQPDDPGTAQQIAWALHDQGIDPEAAEITMRCSPNPDCAVHGDALTLTVRVEVVLPLLPGESGLALPVEASATFPREPFG
ncbi:pilus assembly protein [Gulosibacter sp. 10]|uniref:pilus assembly protein n=1 Tax=Gulosibacter sp. 10 TaxID=1255570 RepID=UPI00111FF604|nr:pilus assembly protein [Gulosibacter sp. 10]